MDHLKIWTEDAPDGYTNVVVEGDAQAFAWMVAAAGNARDGYNRNQADVTDGEAVRLVLQPLVPNQLRDQAPRSRTAHLSINHRAAQEAARITLEESEHAAIPDKVKAELHTRGIRFAIVADAPAPETAPTPPPAGGRIGGPPAPDAKPALAAPGVSGNIGATPPQEARTPEEATESRRAEGDGPPQPQPETPSPAPAEAGS